ncbi:hypothetical protein [Alysiella filiformis]|uniref:RloB-like protein n=2 Tax=Alysiella TaxID=194195 RepID=A0A286E759_9NEIS|nr:hypothetical protein [Alysiella filiformis]QMT31570.1 hypothetical protein H3L97_01270 [Alysiella filiformis]SOD66719.1 hypothetical protein SAMN02746062_00711 [Alysiella filiformis DSM 16848]
MNKVKNPPKITVLVEGENELNFWRKMGFLGRAKIFNLWQAKANTMSGLLRGIQQDEQIIIIADTDVLNEQNRFIANVLQIKKHCKLKPHIIWQIQNFEDELCFSCGCRPAQLFQHFDAVNADEFKNKFNKVNQLENKLTACNHDRDKMWMRSGSQFSLNSSDLNDFIQNNLVLHRR